MLKTNSKKAVENIRSYIVNHFTPDNYTVTPPVDYNSIAAFILDTFRQEKYYTDSWERLHGWTERDSFEDWAAGLPSVIDTCYYYNRSAVDDLGLILEETESEKARYTESAAESLLTRLIYRELIKAERGSTK